MHRYRCVISLDRRVYDCTKFVFEGSPYHHPGGSSNIRREHGRDVGRFFDIFAHTMTAHRLMRKDMLAWDGPLHAGAPSLPACVLTRARRRDGALRAPPGGLRARYEGIKAIIFNLDLLPRSSGSRRGTASLTMLRR